MKNVENMEKNGMAREPWPRVKLGKVCEVITKGTTPTSVGYSFVESGINFVKVESFSENGSLIKDKVAHISQECHLALKRSQLKEGDILFSIAGALGRVAKVDEDILPANTNQALAIIRLSCDSGVDISYLMMALRSPSISLQIEDMKKATAQANLSLQNLRDFTLPLPPLAVQRSIVSRLERELGAVEKVSKKFEEIERAAEGEFKATLKETFDEISRGGAETRRLGDVCETCLGKMLDKAKNKGIPRTYLRNVNVRWFGFETDDLLEMPFEGGEIERYSLRNGDIAMCEGGEPGRCAIWRGDDNVMMIQKAIHRIRPSKAIIAEYLVYLFKNLTDNETLNELFTGTTIKHLTGQVLKQITIPLPPLATQRAIVARLDAARVRRDGLVTAAKDGREAAALWRKAILKEAFE